MLRSSNPVLSQEKFARAGGGLFQEPADAMTLNGTLLKTGVLVALLLVTASYTWDVALQAVVQGAQTGTGGFASAGPWLWGGLIVGFLVALVISFKPTTAPFLAPVYAVAKGLMIGAISAAYELMHPGIVINATLLTVAVLGGMLLLYRAGLIRATARFRAVILCSIFAILGVYLLSFVLGFFGTQIPYIHGSGPIGIGFSLVVVGIASLSLILDFDLIERGIQGGAPKYMEWYAGFALLVTLVWLYLELLRLLSKLQRR